MEEIIYLLALNRILNYDSKRATALMECAGSASALFSMDHEGLVSLLGKRYGFIEELGKESHLKWAEEELVWAQSKGISILTPSSEEYPHYLLECVDRPLMLYKTGPADLNTLQMLSIVGTRRSTQYGEKMCVKIIGEMKDMGLSPVIVSGLAFGIDICAHRAAIANGLATIAVSACSPDKIYPAMHLRDARMIAQRGAVITEFPRGVRDIKVNFLRRNRIIAGISPATIVIESGERGGAMITASLAHSYSREIFALPGRVSDSASMGCNYLISKNIADIVYNTEELVKKLGWDIFTKKSLSLKEESKNSEKQEINSENSVKEKILVTLRHSSELHIDELANMTGLSISSVSTILLELEMEDKIIRLAGERYAFA